MSLLNNIIGGLGFNPEQITHDTIQGTLEDVAIALGCTYKDFFIMIKPCDETFTMVFRIWRTDSGKAEFVDEIKLKDILDPEFTYQLKTD